MLDQRKKTYSTQAQGLGGKANMRLTTVKEIKLGPYRFREVPTYLFDDEYNVTSYPNLGGLVGNDILRRFNVILNYEHRAIYLTPNSHYRDQFDYSYTGLGLYWIEGEVRVGDVSEGQPGGKGGLKEDDVVIAVGTNFTNNIQTYKNLLQNPGEKVKLIIKRKTGSCEEHVSCRQKHSIDFRCIFAPFTDKGAKKGQTMKIKVRQV